MPQWRKELGERVREVQERRLRESALENGANDPPIGDDSTRAPVLELLPPAEPTPPNPIVVAALRRIERAHLSQSASGNYTNFQTAAAVAYVEQPDFIPNVMRLNDEPKQTEPGQEAETMKTAPERVHTLAVVPNPVPAPELTPTEEEPLPSLLKSKRLIHGDANDPALNYLDAIPTTTTIEDCARNLAPIHLRFFAALIDLAVVALLSWVPLALSGLTELARQDNLALVLTLATIVVVAFLYSTIATALTGQTLGMKFFSLRVIDARTRMLPTGSQSAGRAVVYILSVASSGIPLVYALIDRDKRTAHDCFTRTEVVRI